MSSLKRPQSLGLITSYSDSEHESPTNPQESAFSLLGVGYDDSDEEGGSKRHRSTVAALASGDGAVVIAHDEEETHIVVGQSAPASPAHSEETTEPEESFSEMPSLAKMHLIPPEPEGKADPDIQKKISLYLKRGEDFVSWTVVAHICAQRKSRTRLSMLL